MFATGDWEHALVIFNRVKRRTKGANKNAEGGIQRCLEAINNSLVQIKQSQVYVHIVSNRSDISKMCLIYSIFSETKNYTSW